MVSGTDEHGTPIQVQADAEGLTPAPARRQVQRRDHQGPAGPRPGLRPVHPHHHDQPLRGRAEPVPGAAPQRLRRAPSGDGRDQPVHRAHAARPLRRGHLPDLRLRRRPRRPVRQLRQPARPRRPDQPALEDQRGDAGVRRDRALLPRPARVRRVARAVAVHPHRLAAQRAQVLRQPRRRPQAARDHPRPRLGRPDPARRLARPADEAALRVVRRGHRLPVGVGGVGAARPRPGRLEAVVERPGRPGLLLHGQGQHRLPLGDLAGAAAGPERAGRPRRHARARSARSTCRARSSRRSTSR